MENISTLLTTLETKQLMQLIWQSFSMHMINIVLAM